MVPLFATGDTGGKFANNFPSVVDTGVVNTGGVLMIKLFLLRDVLLFWYFFEYAFHVHFTSKRSLQTLKVTKHFVIL